MWKKKIFHSIVTSRWNWTNKQNAVSIKKLKAFTFPRKKEHLSKTKNPTTIVILSQWADIYDNFLPRYWEHFFLKEKDKKPIQIYKSCPPRTRIIQLCRLRIHKNSSYILSLRLCNQRTESHLPKWQSSGSEQLYIHIIQVIPNRLT